MREPARTVLWRPYKEKRGVVSIAGRFIRLHIEGRTAVEEIEGRNAVQYLLMVYLGAKGSAKIPAAMRTNERGSKRYSYRHRALNRTPGVVTSNAASLECQ